MNRRYSLFTLLLVVTLAAFGAGSLRSAIDRAGDGNPDRMVAMAVLGAVVGSAFSLALTIWNRGWGWSVFISPFVGLYLGAAAGAQFSARVTWPSVLLVPAALAVAVTVLAIRRSRAGSVGTPFDRGQPTGLGAGALSGDADRGRAQAEP